MATYGLTWWTAPDVQRDREAFMRAVEAKQPEWLAREGEINRLLSVLQTPDYMVGTPARRRGFSSGRAQVAGL